MKHSISVKQTLVDIISILPQIFQEFRKDEKYCKLLDYLNEKDFFNDEDLPYPTIKQIEAETGLKSHHIRKQLKDLYASLFDYEYGYRFHFDKTEYCFIVDHFKNYATFYCTSLINVPRVGENITLPFLKAKVGSDYFYVEDVRHHFEYDKHLIKLYLKAGRFNSFWYYSKHKGIELGKIAMGEEFELYDFQLKEKLGL
ncbi:hypothetical protein [Aestuariibaculum sediminum]|uniref:Uncharacterized protein n=1 Tax=Aestuariibaculum sediminum TaxID=2770637 RepID=A0A8J6U910_9FLAO|nr:hypothetical protein [Aestuariibaculum sediminum]MBD0833743.1 hypothetical protein [Aestuariibaculum sediminum]